MLLAFISFINTILSYYYIDTYILNYLGGISVFTLAFLYLTSYAFEFCEYHRMFLHYVVLCNVISIIDTYIGLPVSNLEYLMIHMIMAFVCMVIALILYLKNK